jgi:hypothetical protein
MRHTLLPETYVVRSKYRTHWSYRVTWYVILAGLIVNGLMVFSWKSMYEYKKESEDVAATLVESETLLAKEKRETEPLIEKYKELVSWQSYKRVPLAQVLEVIEKNIGRESGLVSLNWDLTEAEASKRRGKVSMKVFVSESGGGTLGAGDPWPSALKRAMDRLRLRHDNLTVSEGEDAPGGRLFDLEFEVSLVETPSQSEGGGQ